MKRSLMVCLVLASCAWPSLGDASALVPWAQRNTVDSDGDSIPDLVDFAPGVFDNGSDLDNDGIGDAIDPTPTGSNPNLGPMLLGIAPVTPIPQGGTAIFDYIGGALPFYPEPPGAYGYIDLDFGGDATFDATYFGPLTLNFLPLAVPANFFTAGNWNLNQPGTYALHATARAPGMSTQGPTLTSVTVTPEPSSLLLAALGLGMAGWQHDIRKKAASRA